MVYVVEFVLIFLQGMQIFLILGTLLTFLLPADNSLRIGTLRIIEPLLRPFRKVIKPISGIDFSPMVLYLLLSVLESLIYRFIMPLVVN